MLRTLFHLIGTHYASGNFGAAESAVRSVLVTVPNDPASLQFLGLVYYRTGRKAEAVHILNSAPPLSAVESPIEPTSREDFLGRNGYSAVAACHLEATQRNPDLALAWLDLGLALGELGQPDRAVVAFRSALAAQPGFPAAIRAMRSFTDHAEIALYTAGSAPPDAVPEEIFCGPGHCRDQADRGTPPDPTALDEDA